MTQIIFNFTGTGDPPLERVESCDLFLPDNLLNLPQLMYGVSAMGRLLVEQVSSYGQTDTDRYLDKLSKLPQLIM